MSASNPTVTAIAPSPVEERIPESAHAVPAASQPAHTDVIPLDPARLLRAKTAYTTRFLADRLADDAAGYGVRAGSDVRPEAGDVVLARVVEIGKHTRLESEVSRRRTLYVGDEILVAYGHRYAPDQFEAEVPAGLGMTNLVAAGGLAGDVTAVHGSVADPTVIEPIGLLTRGEAVVNLLDLAPHRVDGRRARRADGGTPVVAVFGTSMNSGKSTTLACLTRGLAAGGSFVASGKATGTGAGNDRHLFTDAGADRVLDFTDFGHGSTFRLDSSEVHDLVHGVIAELREDPRADVVVVEIADGIFQRETRDLLRSEEFADAVDAVVFAAGDAAGAVAGSQAVLDAGLPLVAVSGLVTASPLATREAEALLDVPVVPTYDLADPVVADGLLTSVAVGR